MSLRLVALLGLWGCASALPNPASTATHGHARPARDEHTEPRTDEAMRADTEAGDVTFEAWSADSFERAARERRLLILSVQTAWCHWCHVMKAQTYADPEVRALIAKHFVVIAADADARPDLATRYAAWGWPATALLTPDAEPIVNLRGYQDARSFAALLRSLVARAERGEALTADALITHAAAERPQATDSAHDDVSARLRALRGRVDGLRDEVQRGYGGPKKYPWAAPIEDALLRALTDPSDDARRYALASLDRYTSLIDPIGGGMFQYSVFNDWEHPHYEKVHTVQADALRIFSLSARVTGQAEWLKHARAILRYVNGPLRSRDGVYYANQDADVGHAGDAGAMTGAQYYVRDAAGRALVNDPRIDKSVYANNNGMTIAALCAYYEATLDRDALRMATQAADRIEATHSAGDLYRHDAVAGDLLYLDDQVQMADALFALHQVTAEPRYWQRLQRLVSAIEGTFLDRQRGGFFAHTKDPHAFGALARVLKPLALNSQLARLLVQMTRVSDKTRYQELARSTLDAVKPHSTDPLPGRGVFEHLRALALMHAPYAALTIVAPRGSTDGAALYAAALRVPQPTRLVRWQAPEESHYPYPGHAVLYLCTQDSCSMPIDNPDSVASETNAAFAAQVD